MWKESKQKIASYFIYALLYKEPFIKIVLCLYPIYRNIHCNWVCWGITTLQVNTKFSCWINWMICIKYIHMHPRDHYERDMCSLSSIIQINHTVEYMQQLHYKAWLAITHMIKKTHFTFKINQPLRMGIPQPY